MALPLSPKLAKMLKSLSVLASRCNVRVDTRWREGKVEGNSVGYPGAIRVIIIGNIINYWEYYYKYFALDFSTACIDQRI